MHEIVLGLFRGGISYFLVHIPIFSSLWLPLVCANSLKLPVMHFWLPPQGFLLENLSEIKLQAGLHQLVRRACSFSSSITILFSTLLSPTAKFFPSYQLHSPSPTAIQTFGNSCLSPDVLVSQPLPLLFKLTCFLRSGALEKVAFPSRLPLPHNMHSITEFKMGFMHFSTADPEPPIHSVLSLKPMWGDGIAASLFLFQLFFCLFLRPKCQEDNLTSFWPSCDHCSSITAM